MNVQIVHATIVRNAKTVYVVIVLIVRDAALSVWGERNEDIRI